MLPKVTEVGAPEIETVCGNASMVNAELKAGEEEPIEFDATTSILYVEPKLKLNNVQVYVDPDTEHVELVRVEKVEPVSATAEYPVMALPPVDADACHVTVAVSLVTGVATVTF